MTPELLLVLSKARIALIIIGITSLFGVTPDWITRLSVLAVALAVSCFDSVVDEHRTRDRTKAPPPRYDTAA